MKISILAVLVMSSVLFGAGFDCNKASSNVEKTICNEYFLSENDSTLSSYFNFVKKKLLPKEATALVSEQIIWLNERNKGCNIADESDRIECLRNKYNDRKLEFVRKYDKLLFNFPDEKELKNICTDLANKPSLLSFLKIREDNFDVNNDGIDENVTCVDQGTAHIMSCGYTTQNGKNIEYSQIGFEWKDFWTYGSSYLNINDRIYKFNSYDDYQNEPAYLSYTTPVNEEYVLCVFENNKTKDWTYNPYIKDAKKVCKTMQNHEGKIELLQEPNALIKQNSRFIQDGWSTPSNEGEIDIDNDGKLNNILEIDYSSGAGRGCGFHFYEELNSKKNDFVQSESSNLLFKMQNSDYGRPSCGGYAQFFKYNNINYLEYKNFDEHKAYLLDKKTIKTVCTSKESITTNVSLVKPEGKIIYFDNEQIKLRDFMDNP